MPPPNQSPQPFNPLELLTAAEKIAAAGDECSLRIAVSRAYYGLFLFAREKSKVVATTDVHAAVINTTRRRNRNAGNLLFELHRLRKVADYELVPELPQDQDWAANWTRHKTIAERLLPMLQRLSQY